MKQAFIYNRWWYRQGGGEVHALAFVPVLEKLGYQVHILTTTWLSKELLADTGKINLSKVVIKKVPDVYDFQLAEHITQADLFINASHLEAVVVPHARNIALVYFPAKADTALREKLKRVLLQKLQTFLLYTNHHIGLSAQGYLSQKNLFTFSEQNVEVSLTLQFETMKSSLLEQIRFYEDQEMLTAQVIASDLRRNLITYRLRLKKARDAGAEIILPSGEEKRVKLHAMKISGWRAWLHRFLVSLVPALGARLRGGATLGFLERMQQTNLILANSVFTQGWIEKFWRVSSKVLYPPVDLISAQKTKKKRIVTTGRFFSGGHNKKQLELIQAFKEFCKTFPEWEYHLIGRVGDESIHRDYLEQVKKEAEGLPVYFHLDVSQSKREELLASAQVYWQGTGWNENEELHPERTEHFGISLVEAMSAGCICFAYNSGGVPEILTDESGYTWRTFEELVTGTQEIIQHPKLLEQISNNARKRSEKFSRSAFERKLIDLLEDGV